MWKYIIVFCFYHYTEYRSGEMVLPERCDSTLVTFSRSEANEIFKQSKHKITHPKKVNTVIMQQLDGRLVAVKLDSTRVVE